MPPGGDQSSLLPDLFKAWGVEVVPGKFVADLTLAQRVHVCPHCGLTMPRDQNSALVVLIDAHTPGTGVAARPKPLARQRAKSTSLTRETPATTTQGV